NNLGSALFSLGDYSAARTIHEDGAHRSFEIGYQMGEGDHLDNIGGTAWAVGDYSLAIAQYRAALEIRDRMDDAWGVAISNSNLGGAYRAQGDPAKGLDLYRRALDIDREIGRRRGEAYDLHGIGLCQLDMGHYNLASEALGQAASIREELGEEHLANESHVACAVAMLRRGDEPAATSLVDRMLERENDSMFDGAVETTATLLRCVEVIAETEPDRATALRAFTSDRVAERAGRISDPDQRESYLRSVEAHRDSRT
ncbi:MAG: tetratricopeptide repeat protein, partial [Acidimicrobiia bacterium]